MLPFGAWAQAVVSWGSGIIIDASSSGYNDALLATGRVAFRCTPH